MDIRTGKHSISPAAFMAGLAFLLLLMGVVNHNRSQNSQKDVFRSAFWSYMGNTVGQKLEKLFLPVFPFAEENTDNLWQRMAVRQVELLMPISIFGKEEEQSSPGTQDQMTIEMILLAEAEEGNETIQESEEEKSLGELLQEENRAAERKAESKAESKEAESREDLTMETSFVPRENKLAQIELSDYTEYENLIKDFYTIDKSTMIGSDQLNVEKLSSEDMTISKTDPGPQILIYHTHSQEAFADSVPGDRGTSIVGVGDYLTQILTKEYGYQVLHHDASYDMPSRDDAYSAALPDIERVLGENPQIQVVIDLHRDAMDESTRLVTEIDGKPTARFMFFNGLSRTRKTGNITYLYNENLESNLAFSFQMEKTAMEYYPGLTRKIYLKAYRYNMHLRPKSLLVELGAQNNTVEEAMNACGPLAHILDLVLSGQE